jgi:uncharacterized protein YciU (UPF0263 family)
MAEQSAETETTVLVDGESVVVEVHVPLAPDPHAADDDEPFPWIDEVIEFLLQLEDDGSLEMWDDGEEWEGHFVFSLADAPEAELLAAARSIAALPGVPSGVFAMVTTSGAEDYGQGTRVEIA